MTAPVSLAEVRYSHSMAQDSPHGHHTAKVMNALPALVELAEAFLAVRALERSANRVSDLTKPELRKAERRLALAAKGVAP